MGIKPCKVVFLIWFDDMNTRLGVILTLFEGLIEETGALQDG